MLGEQKELCLLSPALTPQTPLWEDCPCLPTDSSSYPQQLSQSVSPRKVALGQLCPNACYTRTCVYSFVPHTIYTTGTGGVGVGVKGPETTFHEWTHTRERQNGACRCPPIREPHSFLLWILMELEGQSYFPSRNYLYCALDSWKICK